MADINIGGVEATVSLNASQFNAGINKVVSSLSSLDKSFQQSQEIINLSVESSTRAINTQAQRIRNGLLGIEKAVTEMSRDTHQGFDILSQDFGRVAKNSDATVRALGTLVQELTQVRQAIQGLNVVSRQDFTQGIKRLTNATGRSSRAIIANMRDIRGEAQATNNALNNLRINAPAGGGGNGGNGGNRVPNAPTFNFDFLRGLSNNNTFQGLITGANNFGASLTNALTTFNGMTYQVFMLENGLRQLANVASTVVKPSLDFNQQMETLQYGYAGIISSTMKHKDDNSDVGYNEAFEIANALLARMQDEALKTSLTMGELGTALQATMAMGLNAGMSLEQVLDLTVVGAQAVKTFGLSNQQVIQELRGLISGEAIRPGVDQLATVLGYTTATVNKLREEGKLYDDVVERMKGFRQTSEEFQNTWAGLTSNIEDGISRITGVAGQAMFEVFKKSLKEFQSIFFTTEKIKNLNDGKTLEKVILNENTLNVMTSCYNIIANLWQVIVALAKVVGAVLAPVFRVFISLLSGASRVLAILANLFEPFIDGLQVIGGALSTAWTAVEQFVVWLEDLITGLLGANEGVTLVASALGVTLVGALIVASGPIGWVVAAITGIGLACKTLKGELSSFANWFKAFWENLAANAILYGKKIKATFKAIITPNLSLDEAFAQEGIDGLQLRTEYTHKVLQDAGTQLKKDINNIVDKVKVGDLDALTKNIAAKFTADKQKKGAKGAKNDALKGQYKTLEDAYNSIKKLIEQEIKTTQDLYKNDLMSTQDYVEKTLQLKFDQLEAEKEMLKQKIELAKANGKQGETANLTKAYNTAVEKQNNLLKQGVIDLTNEYKKLDERLDSIKGKYQNLVGLNEQAFEDKLVKEVYNDYARLNKELETANNALTKVQGNSEQTKIWEYRKQKIQEAITAQEHYISLQGLQKAISLEEANIQRTNIDVTGKLLEQQSLVNAGSRGSLALDYEVWRDKQRNADKVLESYQKVISYYKQMEAEALQYGSIEKANDYAKKWQDAKKAMLDFANELSPIRKEIQSALSDGFSNAYQDILWGEKDFITAFGDMWKDLGKQFTKRIFDEAFKGVFDNVFDTLFPKSKISQTVSAEVQVDTKDFVTNIQNAAKELKDNVSKAMIPSFQNLSEAATKAAQALGMIGNTTDDNGRGQVNTKKGTDSGTLSELGSTVGVQEGDNSLSDVNGSIGTFDTKIEYLAIDTLPSFDGVIGDATRSLSNLATSISSGAGGGLYSGINGLALTSKKASAETAKNTKATGEQAMAAGMMAVSLLATTSASEKLQKAMIILQALMTINQIGTSFKLWAEGGKVTGPGTGTSDDIPARLSNGEYVMKATTVRKYGSDFFDRLNYGTPLKRTSRLPRFAFAEGGLVQSSDYTDVGSPNSLGNSDGSAGTVVNMNMTFQSLDPESNMKMMEAQYPTIRQKLLRDLQGNSMVRNAVRGVR